MYIMFEENLNQPEKLKIKQELIKEFNEIDKFEINL